MGIRLEGEGDRCLGRVRAGAAGGSNTSDGVCIGIAVAGSSGDEGLRAMLGLADLKSAATRAPGLGDDEVVRAAVPGLAPCVLARRASQPPLPLPLPECSGARETGGAGSVGAVRVTVDTVEGTWKLGGPRIELGAAPDVLDSRLPQSAACAVGRAGRVCLFGPRGVWFGVSGAARDEAATCGSGTLGDAWA